MRGAVWGANAVPSTVLHRNPADKPQPPRAAATSESSAMPAMLIRGAESGSGNQTEQAGAVDAAGRAIRIEQSG